MADNSVDPFEAFKSLGSELLAPIGGDNKGQGSGKDDDEDLSDLGIIDKDDDADPEEVVVDDKKEVKDPPPKVEEVVKTPKEEKTTKKEAVYKNLFEVFKEEEILTVELAPEDTEYSSEGLIKVFAKEKEAVKKSAVEEYLSPIKDKELIEYLRQGGDFKDYYEKVASDTIIWAAYTPVGINTSAKARETTIAEYMKALGETDGTKIAARIAKLENAGLAQDEVETAHRYLVAKQEEKKAVLLKKTADAAAENKTKDDLIKGKLNEIIEKNPIGGFNPTAKVRQQLKDFITKVDADGLTERDRKEKSLTNEKAIERRVLLSFLEMVDFDMDKLMKMTSSRATNKLAETLESLGETDGGLKSTKVREKEAKKDESSFDADVLKGALGF